MMIGAVKRILDVIAPETDWTWLQRMCANLKTVARPSRDKFAHAVTPEQMFDLGISMMNEAEDKEIRLHPYVSTKARDGLIIAMLISCPVRIANLAEIEIGRHLLFDTDHYWLAFTEVETKTGKEYKSDLPPSLTSRIDWYLNIHRPRLLALGNGSATRRLWIDREGKPMSEAAIRTQIENNSRKEFGKRVWPHLFRTIAVTGLVDEAPEQIGIAPDLLGHTNDQTFRKYYLLATGTRAHQAVQATILQGRAEALRRLRYGD
ncbi:MAG: site-specific integrase [Pseudaminobacter sp.]